MKRRDFLTSTVAAGAAAMLATTATLAHEFGQHTASPEAAGAPGRFSREWFAQLVNTRFQIEMPGGEPVVAKLLTVEDRHHGKGLEQYAAIFRLEPDAHVDG